MSFPRKKVKLMPPIHPGEFLHEDFLIPLGMTAQMLAKEIKVPERRVVAIVKERRGLDADLCLRRARRLLGLLARRWPRRHALLARLARRQILRCLL